MSRGWEHFKPEWRAFWKHAAWKKVWDRAFLLLLFPVGSVLADALHFLLVGVQIVLETLGVI